jgi:hypothetical protein
MSLPESATISELGIGGRNDEVEGTPVSALKASWLSCLPGGGEMRVRIGALGQTLKPGTAALCVLVRQMTPDKVIAEIQKFGGTLIKTNLCNENEAKLREALTSAHKAAPI